MMPGMDGWGVFDKMISNSDWKDIPVVFLTARTDKLAESSGEFFGKDYIIKPVENLELIKRVDKILEKKVKLIYFFIENKE